MKHVEWKCDKGPDLCSRCNDNSHPELFICAICNGAESQLPTDCPGYKLSEEQLDLISQGVANFKGGRWIC